MVCEAKRLSSLPSPDTSFKALSCLLKICIIATSVNLASSSFQQLENTTENDPSLDVVHPSSELNSTASKKSFAENKSFSELKSEATESSLQQNDTQMNPTLTENPLSSTLSSTTEESPPPKDTQMGPTSTEVYHSSELYSTANVRFSHLDDTQMGPTLAENHPSPEEHSTAKEGSSPLEDSTVSERRRLGKASRAERVSRRPTRLQGISQRSTTSLQDSFTADQSTALPQGTPRTENSVLNYSNPRLVTPSQMSTLSLPKRNQMSNCTPQFLANMSDSQGKIEWIQPGSEDNCESLWEWLITVARTSGLVFEFVTVKMLNNFSVSLHEVDEQTAKPKNPPLWMYPISTHKISMAPLLVSSNQLMVRVNGDPTITTEGLSQVNLTYVAHPVKFMPQEVRVDLKSLHPSRIAYNCSSFPKRIPTALQCDMVQQCVGGEDERDCAYKDRAGCGDWVPYGDQCVKAFYQPITTFAPGVSHITMPIQAEQECKTQFQGRLARFPDREGIQLVYALIHQSGYKSASIGLRKMRPRSSKLKHLYKYLYQWGKQGDPVAFEQTVLQRKNAVVECVVFDIVMESFTRLVPCSIGPSSRSVPQGFVCMKPNPTLRSRIKTQSLTQLHFEPPSRGFRRFPTKECPDGSLVQTFHSCEWGDYNMNPVTQAPAVFPSFHCTLGHSVHYSLVCDGIDDCADGSDEVKCMAPRFRPLSDATFTCMNLQNIPRQKRCNGVSECFDGSDEEDCLTCKNGMSVCPSTFVCVPKSYREFFLSCHIPLRTDIESAFKSIPPPAAVVLDGFGMSTLVPVEKECGEGHFTCTSGLCLPAFLVNNGEQDCPSGVDENIPMENFTCPGYYRCQEYGNCVHGKHVCDGIPHCPNQDDERYCRLSCPANCTCEGYAYKCTAMIQPRQNLYTRYLDVSGVVLPDLQEVHFMELLLVLNLSHCQLREVNLTSMPQLQILDLSYNLLSNLSEIVFVELTGLQRLLLSNNPLVHRLDQTFTDLIKHSGLINLQSLSLSNTALSSIENGALSPLTQLSLLDLRGNDLTDFDRHVFDGMANLETLYADNYKLCCPYFHFTMISDCHSPVDELSSCSDLLSNHFYQVFVWLLAALNIPANLSCLVFRCVEMKKMKAKGYTILVANLCLSDLLMGIYLVFIGSADVHYRDVWVSREEEWESSGLCKTAGILAFLSSEVSAFVVCLITLERLLVICFPLKTRFHMANGSTSSACVLAWVAGFFLALLPLMVGWEFYGQNGFCLPLPITRNQFPGQHYAFAIFIVFNFVLFLLIGTGQVLIYWSIKRMRLSSSAHSKLQDMTIARKLMLIIVTDFLCWFPIGLMGLLVYPAGVPIPGEVNVWAALFILPFNSALNPFLYTLNSLLDSHREQRMEKRMQKTIGKINAEIQRWPPDKVETLLKSCIRARVVQKDKVLQWLNVGNNNARVTERDNGAYLHEVELKVFNSDMDQSSCCTGYTDCSN